MYKHHTRKPSDNHAICSTDNCSNYYNVTYSNTYNKCKPCRRRLNCELCDTGIGKKRDDGINVCDSCNEKHPIRE